MSYRQFPPMGDPEDIEAVLSEMEHRAQHAPTYHEALSLQTYNINHMVY